MTHTETDALRTAPSFSVSEVQGDPRAERRALRRAQSQLEILDAAERVFGQDGIRDGSLRKIAAEAGFSTAALYLFFENKQHLLAETLTRRAEEWDREVELATECDGSPLEKLHQIIDFSVEFVAERPHFRLLLRYIRAGSTITGPVLAEFAERVDARYFAILMRIAAVIREGQEMGQIRQGDHRALAHLYQVLTSEFVLIDSEAEKALGTLTAGQFHALIDGALRPES